MDRVAGRLGDSRKMAGVLEKEDKSVKRGKKKCRELPAGIKF